MPLPPYTAFKRSLGKFNALCQLQEIAIRELETRANAAGAAFTTFISDLSASHGIPTRFEEFPPLVDFRCKSYLMVNVAQFERFLHDLEGYLLENQAAPVFGDKRDLHDRLAILIELFEQDQTVGAYLKVINYYRLIRNYAAHPYNSSQVRGEMNGVLPAIDRSIFNAPEFIATAPSSCDKIQYQDFTFCSQVMKKAAFRICDRVWKQFDWSGEKDRLFKKFGRFSTKKSRFRNAILGDLRTRFGLDESEASFIMEAKLGVRA